MPSKLSSRLQMLLETPVDRLRALTEQQRYAIDHTSDQPRFAVIVKYDGDTDALETAGLVMRSPPVGGFATGFATPEAIRKLAALDGVTSISAPLRIKPELNVAVPEIAADLVQINGIGGAGVLVGVIDYGIDWRHPDFRNPNGTTRILAIWDQPLNAQPGESTPANFTFGVEYTSSQINAALLTDNAPVDIRTTDDPLSPHGTHVTGCAAGNGSASQQMVPVANYSGVAPESRILFVRLGRAGGVFETEVIDAIGYLAEKSAGLGRPIAINMSFGNKLGPHDGTSPFEQAIDTILARAVPGLILVKSAGNEGAAAHHVSTTVDTNVATVIPVELALAEKHAEIEFWYPRAERVTVTVTDQGAVEKLTVAPGGSDTKLFPSGDRLSIRSTIGELGTNDNLITIVISRLIVQPLATWSISLQTLTLLPVRVDGYLEGTKYRTRFRGPAVTSAGTITEPGNANLIITVGAYITKGTGYDVGKGDLADFSSRGPTRDGRQKPDVAAPGEYIVSTNGAYVPPVLDGTLPYKRMSGTSMAAPMVTGTAALILTAAPTTLQMTLRSYLRESARSDGQTGEVPNNRWGYGKVDALGAVATAREHQPQPSPPADGAPRPAGRAPSLPPARGQPVPLVTGVFSAPPPARA